MYPQMARKRSPEQLVYIRLGIPKDMFKELDRLVYQARIDVDDLGINRTSTIQAAIREFLQKEEHERIAKAASRPGDLN